MPSRWSARCWKCCPDDAGEELRRFLGPVCESLIEESPFTQAWPSGGPWRAGIQARMGGEGQ